MAERGPSVAERSVATPSQTKWGLSDESQKTFFTGGSVLGALAMSSCCIVPLALFSLGITGAWIGALTALYAYKWYFFVPAAALLAGGYYTVYRNRQAADCARGTDCATPISDRINKVALWSATVVILVALAFPYVAPSLLGVE